MDPIRPDEIEARLLAERDRVLSALQRFDEQARTLSDDGEITHYPLHPADEGTDTIEQEKDMALLTNEGRLLYQIDEALRRFYRDPAAFGRCERCGAAIQAERLALVPWAPCCVDCTQQGRSD